MATKQHQATFAAKDAEEAALITEGLNDATIKAFVLVAALLKRLPTDRARQRAMSYVRDHFDEKNDCN